MAALEFGGEVRELKPQDVLAVGSGGHAWWRITRNDLAAVHFEIRVDDSGAAVLSPTSPQHIVTVAGHPVDGAGVPLRDGDTIAAGSARFRFLANGRPPASRPKSPEGPAWLIDERARVAYALDRRSVPIGRDGASTILVRDPHVSRFHADVRQEAAAHVLYSVGPAGTLVNGRPVEQPHVLREGDRVQLGDRELRFHIGTLSRGMRRTNDAGTADDAVSTAETGEFPTAADAPAGRRQITGLTLVLGVAAAIVLVALVMLIAR